MLFNNNIAKFGGALYIETKSSFTVLESPLLIFRKNKADLGGAIYFTCNSAILFKKHSFASFYYNTTDLFRLSHSTYSSTNKNTMAIFINNTALQGGAIYVRNHSLLQIKETSRSLVIFMYNKANGKGGAISCHDNSNILFEEKAYTIFANNSSTWWSCVFRRWCSCYI